MAEPQRRMAIALARNEVAKVGSYREPEGISGDELVMARLMVNHHALRARDALACNLLCYAALLLEEQRLSEAHEALSEASTLLDDALALSDGATFRNPVLSRLLILAAACHYNMAVLFSIAGSISNVLLAWRNVRNYMEDLNEEDRELELYKGLERVVVNEFPKFRMQ